MIFRCILPTWLEGKLSPKTIEGELSDQQVQELNESGYNIYYFPNYPSEFKPGDRVVSGKVDTFQWVFIDMDLKDGFYPNKESFIEVVKSFSLLPSLIVDSGNGVHAYWKVSDLDAMSFLRIGRRLMRHFITDDAVQKLCQLMRYPGTANTKNELEFKKCEVVFNSDNTYTCEDLDKALEPISLEDEEYCQTHYNKSMGLNKSTVEISDKLPPRFRQFLREVPEAKEIFTTVSADRSGADYRLGHLMFAHEFTKEEAMSVLIHSPKASERAPEHRISYAENIVDKIWTFEMTDTALNLSSTVAEILKKKPGSTLKGTRFPCWKYIDNTLHGFRLGQVIGLVAGSGVGKTAFALNKFMGFVQNNPDYEHFFIPLEQPANEIADRWQKMCGERTYLHKKVHVMSNYDDETGAYRNLSFSEIKDYILKFQKVTGKKVGCIVIDHIGALKKKGSKAGEGQDLMDICHQMKAFAVETNTLLVMQSQAPREKAGIGDLELNKDAAYGTVFFESYCDYLITLWQPIKRCYSEDGCPSVTAVKFCKIRHKNKNQDIIQEDVRYALLFDPDTELMREMTEDENKSFKYFNNRATNARKQDRKTDLIEYVPLSEKGNKHENLHDSIAENRS